LHYTRLLQQGRADRFTFGNALFALTFDAQSLALINISSCAAGREQGFLWPRPAIDTEAVARQDTEIRREAGTERQSEAARETQIDGFSLWQLNYSDCSALTPGGSQLDALASPSGGRDHSLQRCGKQRAFP
jgi:hypothetical protein